MSDKSRKWELRVIGDGVYEFDTLSSALQKAIRRGQEYNAVFFAYVLYASGYGDYIFRRLSIIASEDVGGGDNNAAILISSLRESYERLHKHNKEYSLDKFLFIFHAVLYMCRASKSRENDSLANVVEENWKLGQRLEIPPEAKDSHTRIGRTEFGRFGDLTDGKEELRIEKWLSEWAKVDKEAYPDKWKEALRNIWVSRTKSRKSSSVVGRKNTTSDKY